jgi:phosphatidylserine/phosphatidylglycerophosphate/cardiolipin synthase-like enzyme
MQTIIGKNYPKIVIPLIEKAVKSIKIVVYDWRWYENEPANPCQLFNASIVRAKKRGISVQACVNSNAIKSPLSQNGVDVRIPISKNLIHTKFIIIDDKILIMGSHNFSQSAFTTNFETSVVIENEKEIEEFISFFNSIWQL